MANMGLSTTRAVDNNFTIFTIVKVWLHGVFSTASFVFQRILDFLVLFLGNLHDIRLHTIPTINDSICQRTKFTSLLSTVITRVYFFVGTDLPSMPFVVCNVARSVVDPTLFQIRFLTIQMQPGTQPYRGALRANTRSPCFISLCDS